MPDPVDPTPEPSRPAIADPVAAVPAPTGGRPGLRRRAAAFAVDLALVWAIWSLVDDLLAFPVPRLVPNLLLVATYVLYQGWARTPGRALCGLQPVMETDGREAERATLFRRAAVVAALLLLDWPLVVETVTGGRAPVWLAELADVARWSLLVVSALLAVVDPAGRTLHDRLAGTRLVRTESETAPTSGLAAARAVPGWVPVAALALVMTVAAIGFLVVPVLTDDAIDLAALSRPVGERRAEGRAVERLIADQLDLRSDVAWGTWTSVAGTNAGSSELDATIELPLLAWLTPRRPEVLPLVLSRVTVPDDRPFAGSVTVQSTLLFFTFRRSVKFDARVLRDIQRELAVSGDPQAQRLHAEVVRQRRADGPPTEAYALAMMELGVHFLAVDRAPEARHLLEDAFAALREAPDATAEGRAEVAYNLGLAHLARGQLAVADSLYDQARRVLDGMPAGEPRPLVDLWVAGGRAELAYARGRRAEARAAYHDAVRRAEAAGEPGAEMLVKMLAGLAFVMREEGDEDGAREHLLRARALGDTLADLDPALVRLIDTMLAGES